MKFSLNNNYKELIYQEDLFETACLSSSSKPSFYFLNLDIYFTDFKLVFHLFRLCYLKFIDISSFIFSGKTQRAVSRNSGMRDFNSFNTSKSSSTSIKGTSTSKGSNTNGTTKANTNISTKKKNVLVSILSMYIPIVMLTHLQVFVESLITITRSL
jgi:hypothetical protein